MGGDGVGLGAVGYCLSFQITLNGWSIDVLAPFIALAVLGTASTLVMQGLRTTPRDTVNVAIGVVVGLLGLGHAVRAFLLPLLQLAV